jgi:two-component system NtrC family sensor kinase
MQSQKMEALGQLTGGIAHDFNNMLMVVSGHTQSLKRRLSSPRDLRSLEAIDLAAERGESLTRQLLAFSRRQSLNPKCIKLDRRINAIRDLLLSSAPGNIELKIEIPADVWPVAVDPSEFELALVNVVVNARDAMPDGGSITIASENLQLGPGDTPDGLHGSFVALKVSDTGMGIEPEVLPKVFEPFFTTKQVGKGTGLGLSQVYGFSRQSGGATMISSQIGRGTTVTIYLPLSNLPIDEDVGLPAAEEPGYGNETILLAEDNAEVAAIAASLLEQLGYRTRRVASAMAALEVLASGVPIDLVLSDVVMPGIDGLTLAKQMKEKFPQIPIMLTSGYAKALAAAERGFPILHKPYKLATLGQAVRQAIDRSRAAKLPV